MWCTEQETNVFYHISDLDNPLCRMMKTHQTRVRLMWRQLTYNNNYKINFSILLSYSDRVSGLSLPFMTWQRYTIYTSLHHSIIINLIQNIPRQCQTLLYYYKFMVYWTRIPIVQQKSLFIPKSMFAFDVTKQTSLPKWYFIQ